MRKTKIICTIGPASASEEILTQMCHAGMNVARLNFSHGTHEEQKEKIELIKRVREKLKVPLAIMLDTKGPEYRIKTFRDGKIQLKKGDRFTFTVREIEGDETAVSVTYKNMIADLSVGDTILLNNGLLSFEVESLTDTDAHCRVLVGGELSNRKSMNFPGKVLKQKYLSEQDKADLLFGIENGVDFIACSFVSVKQDLLDVREFLQQHDAGPVELIAKIENRTGVENIREICEACDGIMIGRGDMGVEIPFEELPAIQKHLIFSCRMLGKRVITATEMLESMIYNVRPTRAEISDVANAVYDGTSALMLSGETAAGRYPVLAVETMSKIARETEQHIHYNKRFRNMEFVIHNTADAVSHATCAMALDLDAKAIVACTLSGKTARMVSRFRPPIPIIGMTTSENTWRKLSLSWGVMPQMCEAFHSTDELFERAKCQAKERMALPAGSRIVITGGVTGVSGSTNTIKAETIE